MTTATTFERGTVVTNGSQAMTLETRVERDPRWKTAGWRGTNVALERFGGNPGMTQFVPDYLLANWREVPMDWAPVTGGGLEERYVWSADYRRLTRELREA